MKFRHSNKAKRVCPMCRNNGSCSWCRSNREHQWKKKVVPGEMHIHPYDYAILSGYSADEAKEFYDWCQTVAADEDEHVEGD